MYTKTEWERQIKHWEFQRGESKQDVGKKGEWIEDTPFEQDFYGEI